MSRTLTRLSIPKPAHVAGAARRVTATHVSPGPAGLAGRRAFADRSAQRLQEAQKVLLFIGGQTQRTQFGIEVRIGVAAAIVERDHLAAVDERWHVARTDAAEDAHRHLPAVGKGALGIMTADTCEALVAGQDGIQEQAAPQRHFFSRQRVVGRDWHVEVES